MTNTSAVRSAPTPSIQSTQQGAARQRRSTRQLGSSRGESITSGPPVRVRQSTRRSVDTTETPLAGRRSTRSTRSTRGSSGQIPQRTTGTRERKSTRKQVPLKDEPKSLKERVYSYIFKEREVTPPPPRPMGRASDSHVSNRREYYGEQREKKRMSAPLHFMLVMFLVVCISVFAFGLLRGNSPANTKPSKPEQTNQEVIYEQNQKSGGTTSTNTGILRGKE